MKAVLFVVCILMVTNVFAQEKYLSFSNAETGKEVVFKQNKRVRVRTVQGGKLNGKLQIINETQVMINNVIIPITSIEKIKKNPLALQVGIQVGLIYFGVAGVLGGLIVLSYGQEIGFAVGLIAGGAGLITSGVLAPNFLPSTTIFNNTKIKVVL